jgi:hypothetical protein
VSGRGLESGEGHVRRRGEDKGVHGVVSVVTRAGVMGGADLLYPGVGDEARWMKDVTCELENWKGRSGGCEMDIC